MKRRIYLYQVDDIVGDYKILKQITKEVITKNGKSNHKAYEVVCIHCGEIFLKRESHLKKSNKCIKCSYIRGYKYKKGDIVSGFKVLSLTKQGSMRAYELLCLRCNKICIKTENGLMGSRKGCQNCRMSYHFNVGDIINGQLILKQIRVYNKKSKAYVVKCLIDGHEREVTEDSLEKGIKCPVCSNKICVKGINDIAATHPYLVKYFVNPEDAYTHTYCSNKKCLMKCPDCGFEKWMKISDLFIKGFLCNRCSDGVSYPNKFVISMIHQLNIEFKPEKIFH